MSAVIMFMAIRLCSFNCRGFKGSTADLATLAKSFDLICLQGTWLMDNELSLLNCAVPGMSGIGISATDSSARLLCGRPHGGVAFLWQKSLGYNAHYLYSGCNWCLAISLTDNKGDTLNVVKVMTLCCQDYDLVLIDGSLPASSYTFVSDVWHSTSWLDHCIGPQYILDMIDDCYIDSYNSDHYPLAVTISFPLLGTLKSHGFLHLSVFLNLTLERSPQLILSLSNRVLRAICAPSFVYL